MVGLVDVDAHLEPRDLGRAGREPFRHKCTSMCGDSSCCAPRTSRSVSRGSGRASTRMMRAARTRGELARPTGERAGGALRHGRWTLPSGQHFQPVDGRARSVWLTLQPHQSALAIAGQAPSRTSESGMP